MNLEQFIDLVYLASGLILFLLSGMIFKENPKGKLNIVSAMMLFFAGVGPFAVAVYGSFLEGIPGTPQWFLNSFYFWELFFPSLLYFAAIFPEPQPFYFKYNKLLKLAFIPTIFHLLMVVFLAEPEKVLGLLRVETTLPIIGVLLTAIFGVLRMIAAFLGFLLLFHSRFFSMINLAYVVLALLILYYGYRRIENPRMKQQVKVVIYGISIGVGLYTLAFIIPTIFSIRLLNPVRDAMVMMGLIVGPGSISWAIVRYQFLDIRLIARKSLVYSISTSIVVGGYLIIVMQAGAILEKLMGRESEMLNILVIIIMLLFFQPIYTQVDDFVKKIFIRSRGDYNQLIETISRDILTIFHDDKLAATVIETLKRDMFIENVEVCFPDGERSFRPSSSPPGSEPIEIENSAYNYLLSKQNPVFMEELSSRMNEKRFSGVFPTGDIEVIIPLVRNGTIAGLILLSNKIAGFRYSSEDISFLKIIANQIVVAMANSELYRESLEKQRMEEELSVAKKIQKGLLPKSLPSLDNFDFAAFIEPSRQVGGDYYDFISVDGSRTGIVIADASGKGVPAALFTARLQVMMQSEIRFGNDINEMMASVNSFLAGTTPNDSFATCFYGEIDDSRRKLRYCNAGHNYPIIVRKDGTTASLEKGGLLLGAIPEARYETGEISLAPGDMLVMFTDGLSEAMNNEHEEYGERRIADFIIKNKNRPIEDICSMTVENVKRFASGHDDFDDMTLIIIRAKEMPGGEQVS